MVETQSLVPRPVTRGPGRHFFGYYDVTPWDATGRYMLGLEVGFQGRPQTPADLVTVGVIDTAEDDRWRPVAKTPAWNWQMGTRLQWLPSAPGRLIVHNDLRSGGFVGVVRDAFTGREEAVLPRPVYSINTAGTQAVSLNFARVARTRPGYGYVGTADPTEGVLCPADDGIWRIDLASGRADLILTLAGVAAVEPRSDMEGAEHWFNHLLWAPGGDRFIFLHRWTRPGKRGWFTRLFTARADGTHLCLLADDDLVSHFDWRDGESLLAWARVAGQGDHYFLFRDCAKARAGAGAAGGPAEAGGGAARGPQPVGADLLDCDGHCSYSPDRRWVLTDTYPDAESKRTLLLYEPATGRRVDIARLYSMPVEDVQCRCDLHPRWRRDGSAVCVDSTHEGERQIYVLDVRPVVGGGGERP